MTPSDAILAFLSGVHPYDALPGPALERLALAVTVQDHPPGAQIYDVGAALPGLYLIERGTVEVQDASGALVSILGPRNSFGERGLFRDGHAATQARVSAPARLLLIPGPALKALVAEHPALARFFDRSRPARPGEGTLATLKVADLMSRDPLTIPAGQTVQQAAARMRDAHVSSLAVMQGDALAGIVTTRDLSGRVLAEGLDVQTPVAQVMTPAPLTLGPSDLGGDVLRLMLERGIGHVPVIDGGRLVGMVTQTDVTRFQAVSGAGLLGEAARATDVAGLAAVTARIPQLLVQLVAASQPPEVTTRVITDIADAVTRRLVALAGATLGPAPVPWLWLACGSQGRQEQTGVSDQDNCLMIDDAATEDDLDWFRALARFVSDGLHACGYVYCPGDMMATNPRWCQPVRVWRDYFTGWIARPDPQAQMLASVMFDLRPIAGTEALFHGLQAEVLGMAARNSIFVAHMVANSLGHAPPLGLLRGLATFRSGEHRDRIDMKHNGVVPVTDLARCYALIGQLAPVNTRARLAAATAAGVISATGGRDLTDAYEVIAEARLDHQVRLIRAGSRPDNYLAPAELSDFDRAHLRDAFVVVRTMQSALGQSRGARM